MSIVSKEAVAIEVPQKQKVPFYISRNYAFLWGGQAISNLGDLIFDTTLTLWIAIDLAKGQTWAPMAMGGAVICAAIPTILIGPVAGVFVDRWDKKRTMIRMDVIRAICVALLLLIAVPLPFVHIPPIGEIGAIYLFIILTTICTQFFGPARSSIIQDVVDEKEFEHASGLAMLTQNLSRIIGPSLAAPTLFVFGIQWALLINAASFLISAAAVRKVHSKEQQRRAQEERRASNFWQEFKEGLLFFRQSRLLLILLIALAIVLVGDSAEQTLSVFFVLNNLHTPIYLYGIIGTVGGAGGILGALLATIVVKRIGSLRSFWMGMVGFGLVLFLFSRMTMFAPTLVLIFLAGFPIAATNVAFGPLMLRTIPRGLFGRINAVFSTCLSIASILTVSLVTTLASLLHNLHVTLLFLQFGPYDTVLSLGGLTTLLVGIGVALSFRTISIPQPAAQPVQQSE